MATTTITRGKARKATTIPVRMISAEDRRAALSDLIDEMLERLYLAFATDDGPHA